MAVDKIATRRKTYHRSFDRGKRNKSTVLAYAALFLSVLTPAAWSANADPGIRHSDSPAAIARKYIVVLKDNASLREEGIAARARRLADEHVLGYVYERALHGFSVEMSETEALHLATDPDVDYVEQDQAAGRGADYERWHP